MLEFHMHPCIWFRPYSDTPDRYLMWCQYPSIKMSAFLIIFRNNSCCQQYSIAEQGGSGRAEDNTDPFNGVHVTGWDDDEKHNVDSTHAQKLPYVSWSMYLSGVMVIAHLISIGLCFGVFNYSKTEYSITWKASNHNCSTRVLIFPWKRSDWNSPALLSRAITNAF